MSGGGTETVQTNNFPEWAIPHAQKFLNYSQQVAEQPYQAYEGATVAQQNPYQAMGLNAQAQRALQGSAVNDAASGEVQKTLSGGYLNNNPHINSMVDQSSADVLRNYNQAVKPQYDTAMARSGSFGNSGIQSVGAEAQRGLAQELGRVSTNIRGGDYAAERGRMQSALGYAPAIANQDYVDADRLTQAGAGFQAQEQANLNDEYRRFTEARDYPQQQLATLGKGLGLNYGSSTQQPGSNGLAQGIGTGLALYGAYNGYGGGSSSTGGGK